MLLVVFALAIGVGVIVTRTPFGREQIRRIVERRLTGGMQQGGSVYIGRITGGLLGGFAVDSFALRDTSGQLVVSAGRTTVEYDPRDLLDRRLLVKRLEVEHPYIHLVQHEDGSWNYKQIFKRAKEQVERRVGRKFGDFVVVDEARVRDATFLLTMPWHPADSLRGARRDSAIAEHLGRPGGAFRRTRDGHFAHTYRWTEGYAVLSHARIADPDSVGRSFVVDTLHVVESEPPFRFRNARANVRQLGDSVWFEAPHFDTPASTGRGRGKVVWGSGLPTRYDIRVWGDSVSLKDVAWVYPTLPTTGGGTMVLHIRNDPKNLRVIDYRLTEMDVRTTGSRLRGAMTFAVGGPVLVVKDVDVRADPVDFDLLRTFAGGPFPVDWQGTVTGTVRARGGPLTHFVVDDADVVYRDKHVRGAVSRLTGRGGLNILDPEFTEFHDFAVDVASLDLRTIQYLYPEFPPLGGTIQGVATLDSSWLDVRFRDADVTHRNGPETPSRVTGSGRVTYGDEFMVYDVDVVARPLSLPMMARAYPTLPLTGLVSGPIRARGTTDSLTLLTTLSGEGGTLQFDGEVDIYEPVWKARGTGAVVTLDAARVFTVEGVPATSLNGSYDIDMSFTWGGPTMDSLVALGGRLAVDLDRSAVDSLRIEPSEARLRFAEGRVLVDSARVAMLGGVVTAAGGVGLAGGTDDSLRIHAVVDSLGALRRYLASAGVGTGAGEPDSLNGTLIVDAVARGRLDALSLTGTVTGDELVVGANGAERLAARFDVADVTGAPAGTADLSMLRTSVAGVRSDSLTAQLALDGAQGGTIGARLYGGRGPSAQLHAGFLRSGDRTAVDVDTLTVFAGDHSLTLASPARMTLDTAGGVFLDPLMLRDPHHGTIALSASLPATGPIAADVRADSIAIEDLASVLQRPVDARGAASLVGSLRGTRDRPVVQLELQLDEPGWGNARFDSVVATAAYDTGLVTGRLDVRRGGRQTVAGALELPMMLTVGTLRTDKASPIRGWIAVDSTDLTLLEAFPAVANTSGILRTRLDLGGTWGDPVVEGYLKVDGGAADVRPLGIRLRNVTADLALLPGADSLVIRELSGRSAAGTISAGGWLAFTDLRNPRFDLRLDARNFHAIDNRRVAQLDISTGGSGLRLYGRTQAATLTGTVSVDRGTIFIPDTRNKAVVELTGADLFALLDTAAVRDRGLVPAAPSRLVENLRLDGVSIQLGDEVWLRSREANVKLGGSLRVTRAADDTRGFATTADESVQYRLALAGALSAERGTYTLDLGLVRREFQVESGSVTFFGTSDLNPALDIAALHTVKQRDQDDVRVRARLTGFLYPAPTLTLESASGYAMSQSDLISYLVTGRPNVEQSFAEGRSFETATSVLLPSVGSVASAKLREQFGGWVDQIRFETGTGSTEIQSAQQVFGREGWELLYTSRVGGEKQIGDNWFVSLSSGLCQLDSERQSADPALKGFVDQLAWNLEYRFPESLTLHAGREPSRSAYGCGREGMRGVVNTPAQWAVSLSRSWRF